MSTWFEQLPLARPAEGDSDKIYEKKVLRAHSTEIIDLPSGFLAVHCVDNHVVSFACFAFYSGYCEHPTDEDEYELVFQGYGFAGLRECRHTYWGAAGDGYIFYPTADLISGAMQALKKWFMMTP